MFVGALYMTSGTVRRKGLGLLIGGALACLCGPSVFAELRYEAKIIGIEDSQLADLLDDVSELKSLDDRLPASEEALRRRAERDLDRLRDAARGLGYWNAEFSYEIDSAVDPVRVVVVANPGPLYRITSIDVRGPGGPPLLVPIDPNAPPLSPVLRHRRLADHGWACGRQGATQRPAGHAHRQGARDPDRRDLSIGRPRRCDGDA
jgi:hypothetical protein